jgi:hypothetical protein
MNRRNINDLLRESRRGLSRLEPQEAAELAVADAYLIDVRTS